VPLEFYFKSYVFYNTCIHVKRDYFFLQIFKVTLGWSLTLIFLIDRPDQLLTMVILCSLYKIPYIQKNKNCFVLARKKIWSQLFTCLH